MARNTGNISTGPFIKIKIGGIYIFIISFHYQFSVRITPHRGKIVKNKQTKKQTTKKQNKTKQKLNNNNNKQTNKQTNQPTNKHTGKQRNSTNDNDNNSSNNHQNSNSSSSTSYNSDNVTSILYCPMFAVQEKFTHNMLHLRDKTQYCLAYFVA